MCIFHQNRIHRASKKLLKVTLENAVAVFAGDVFFLEKHIKFVKEARLLDFCYRDTIKDLNHSKQCLWELFKVLSHYDYGM